MTNLLSDAQLHTEINRCETCETKPCTEACPTGCSPANFILAIKCAEQSDYERAAHHILSHNPFGGICGAVCPQKFCVNACVHKHFDTAINIPAVQATIIEKAAQMNVLPHFKKATEKKERIAVIGAGPSGISTAFFLSQKGFHIDIFEKEKEIGGMCHDIQERWLPKKVLETNLAWLAENFENHIHYEQVVDDLDAFMDEYDAIVLALGKDHHIDYTPADKIFVAGDMVHGRTTVVEAVASGKNVAECVASFLEQDLEGWIPRSSRGMTDSSCESINMTLLKNKNDAEVFGTIHNPVELTADFFGRKILSPFLLSAAPHTDGYELVVKAYEAGWPGVVMKTAFDNVPIHIPKPYMFAFNENTYANCDNVSCHPLDRVCDEIAKLVHEYPDRLTMGSTGGSVTGNDEVDKKTWQSNTLKLEQAGAMGIEYSLSCPQGGDGTRGDLVSQDPELTEKIIDWVMEISDPNIPKLFKLTGAVTSVIPIVEAVKKVFQKYPNKKAGITLANSFPTLAFRKYTKEQWEDGVVVGMSGDGTTPISYLTLARAAPMNITISGNGGPMDYRSAANFLALGAKTVQFCSIAMKYGVHIIDELQEGLSYFLQKKGFHSVEELIGYLLPQPITEFTELPSKKKIPKVVAELCEHCGNCTRCPYDAITLDENKIPVIDSGKCVGCSMCVLNCFAGALCHPCESEDPYTPEDNK